MIIRLDGVLELEGQPPRALNFEFSDRAEISLGRDKKSDVRVPLTTVSRKHARIIIEDGVFILEDRGSTHGTMVNGRRLDKGEKVIIRSGDTIEVPKCRFLFRSESTSNGAEREEKTEARAMRMVDQIIGALGETREVPRLRVMNGPNEGDHLEIADTVTEYVIGRSKQCDLRLDDPNISRRHAIVKKDWNGVTIADQGSKNGIIVNGRERRDAVQLKDRDEVVIGSIKMVYVDPDADIINSLGDIPGLSSDGETQMGAASRARGLDDLDPGRLEDPDASSMGIPEEGSAVAPVAPAPEGAEDDEEDAPAGDAEGEADGDAAEEPEEEARPATARASVAPAAAAPLPAVDLDDLDEESGGYRTEILIAVVLFILLAGGGVALVLLMR